MGRTYMKYSAVLIGLYLLVRNATGAGNLIKQAASGASTIDKTLQGR
ncbi:hypothetical protein OG762_52440 (plasmid) [Streptomyces sp. NBC_01136]|nr:hypothetical protein OG762_52440 [Streptomyces sp. NBC_01136]